MKAIETMRLVQTLKIYLWTNLENVKTSTLEGKKSIPYACREDTAEKRWRLKIRAGNNRLTDTEI